MKVFPTKRFGVTAWQGGMKVQGIANGLAASHQRRQDPGRGLRGAVLAHQPVAFEGKPPTRPAKKITKRRWLVAAVSTNDGQVQGPTRLGLQDVSDALGELRHVKGFLNESVTPPA